MYKWIPKLKNHLPDDLTKVYDFSNISKEYARSCQSLVDIQEYFDMDPLILAKGNIINHKNDHKYISASELKSLDLFSIAKEARKAYNYEGAVMWLKATLNLSKDEGHTSKYISKIRYCNCKLSKSLFKILKIICLESF